MTDRPRILVGVPARRFDRMDVVDWTDQFLYSGYPAWKLGPPDSSANLWKKTLVSPRVDMDRSKLIGFAKKFGFSQCWMLDTDVRAHDPNHIESPAVFANVVAIVEEALDEFDVLVVPTIQALGPGRFRVMVWPEPKEKPAGTFAIDEGAAGFIVFGPKYLKEMMPVGVAKYMDGEIIDKFCEYPHDTSEDISLCREARKQGFKIGAVPQVVVSHEKAVSYTNQWPEGMKPG